MTWVSEYFLVVHGAVEGMEESAKTEKNCNSQKGWNRAESTSYQRTSLNDEVEDPLQCIASSLRSKKCWSASRAERNLLRASPLRPERLAPTLPTSHLTLLITLNGFQFAPSLRARLSPPLPAPPDSNTLKTFSKAAHCRCLSLVLQEQSDTLAVRYPAHNREQQHARNISGLSFAGRGGGLQRRCESSRTRHQLEENVSSLAGGSSLPRHKSWKFPKTKAARKLHKTPNSINKHPPSSTCSNFRPDFIADSQPAPFCSRSLLLVEKTEGKKFDWARRGEKGRLRGAGNTKLTSEVPAGLSCGCCNEVLIVAGSRLRSLLVHGPASWEELGSWDSLYFTSVGQFSQRSVVAGGSAGRKSSPSARYKQREHWRPPTLPPHTSLREATFVTLFLLQPPPPPQGASYSAHPLLPWELCLLVKSNNISIDVSWAPSFTTHTHANGSSPSPRCSKDASTYFPLDYVLCGNCTPQTKICIACNWLHAVLFARAVGESQKYIGTSEVCGALSLWCHFLDPVKLRLHEAEKQPGSRTLAMPELQNSTEVTKFRIVVLTLGLISRCEMVTEIRPDILRIRNGERIGHGLLVRDQPSKPAVARGGVNSRQSGKVKVTTPRRHASRRHAAARPCLGVSGLHDDAFQIKPPLTPPHCEFPPG
ncbi:hypothetical protein PR048_018182 [Dryococelus australis]|uniref:Uncharacterized protein n=1 Tax=Dryococelus australis TaxID=614101 RepID=A0ABQ9HBR1_9NEOP|nr:hypothetical protein PR048_018182 [Dryococelus australis]